jgi:hypothetical protein
MRKPKLSAIMAGFFVCLSIPILIFILLYNYHRNSETMIAILHEDVAKTSRASIENVEAMIGGVAATLRLLAQVTAADPSFFRTERSNDVLFRALTTADEIDAAFVSFEDGYHRAVTRIDDDRRRSDQRIPRNASWHANFIDDFSLGGKRSRHRAFFDTWPHVVGEYAVPTTTDYRTTSGYPEAKRTRALAVADPQINVDTGYPIINLRVPILHDGAFIGSAGASITLGVLSQFLATHRASPHSTTIIADPTDGKVIAASDRQKSVRVVDGRLEVARLDNIDDADARQAYQLQGRTKEDDFLLRSLKDGQELSASFARFPVSFHHQWEAIILTPTDDFIGELKKDEPADPPHYRRAFCRRAFSDLLSLPTPLASHRKHLARAEIRRDLVLRPTGDPSVQSERNCAASISGSAVTQFSAVVLLVCASGCRSKPYQVGNSASSRSGKAVSDHPFCRSGEFLDARRTVDSRCVAGPDVGLFRKGLAGDLGREGNRRQVHWRRARYGICELKAIKPDEEEKADKALTGNVGYRLLKGWRDRLTIVRRRLG